MSDLVGVPPKPNSQCPFAWVSAQTPQGLAIMQVQCSREVCKAWKPLTDSEGKPTGRCMLIPRAANEYGLV